MKLEINVWLEILLLLPTVTSIVGVIIGGILFNKLNDYCKYIYFYLVAAFITDIASRYLDVLINNNLILVSAFGFIELLIFSMIYYRLLSKKHHWLFKPIIAVLLLLIIIDIILVRPLDVESFNSYGRVLDGVTIILLSVYFYWKVLKKDVIVKVEVLRFNGVVLLFFLINTLLFLVTNFLVNTPYNLVFSILLINIIATPLFYVFLTFQLWHNGKIQKR